MPEKTPKDAAPKDEKKDGDKKDDEKKDEKKEEKKVVKKVITGSFEDVANNIHLLERAVESANPTRGIARLLRHNTAIRRQVKVATLCDVLRQFLPLSLDIRPVLLERLERLPPEPAAAPDAMDVEGAAESGDKPMDVDTAAPAKAPSPKEPPASCTPEVECYLALLALTTILRSATPPAAGAAPSGAFADGKELVELLVGRVRTAFPHRRSMDALAAKSFFYLSLVYEQCGGDAAVRPLLLAAHRTACLRHDEMCQATLLNLLLRSLLNENLVEHAYKLVSKTAFPESVSNNQFCRYLYFTGRIQALQLDYTDAYTKLMQSQRKAPATTARGFRIAINKLMVIVQLLMGEVPDRSVFAQPEYQRALKPYLALTHAVRRGSLAEFNACVSENGDAFRTDKTYTLVIRLGHNVVKAGLRRLSVSYSRISLEDVSKKLQLESPAAAEFVCAKAIKDGVIDAVIDHDKGWMSSRELGDVYATGEPQKAFHRRIIFCLDVHNEAVKAMRYPQDAHKDKTPKEPKGDDEKTEEEIAKEIEDELSDDL